jgi:hypothetical protein
MSAMTREHMEVGIVKAGGELQIHYACCDQEGLALPNSEHPVREGLGGIKVGFGVNGIPDNRMLTENLRYIAAGYAPDRLPDPSPL